MASKIVFFCASALLVQVSFGQFLPYQPSVISGNVDVENNIVIGNSGLLGNAGGLLGSTGGLIGSNVGYGLGYGSNLIGGFGTTNLGTSGLINGYGGLNGGLYGGSLNAGGLLYGSGNSVVSSSPFIVTSVSPISPTGLAVATELIIEGNVVINGILPYLSAVAFESALPSVGSGVATCGCGIGSVGIIGEGFASPLPLPIPAIPYGFAGIY